MTNNIEEALYLADRIVVISNCPATVKKEYVIDMPRPRNYVSPRISGAAERDYEYRGQDHVRGGRTMELGKETRK